MGDTRRSYEVSAVGRVDDPSLEPQCAGVRQWSAYMETAKCAIPAPTGAAFHLCRPVNSLLTIDCSSPASDLA